jgi:hypothetical protein
MKTKQLSCNPNPKRSERGQSMVVVAVSLAALLLLVVGGAFITMAFFTSSAVTDPDQGVLFGLIEPEDVTGVMEETIASPTATPSLGAIVGNQVYLVDPVGVNTLNLSVSP